MQATKAARRTRFLAPLFALLTGMALNAADATAQTTTTIPSGASYSCDFENTHCDFYEQSKVASSGGRRSTFVHHAASGATGIKLTTQVGDSQVNGSGTWERNDLSKPAHPSYCNAGQEEWWGFSILFPDDYTFPPGPEAGIIMDFHHSGSSGQANYEIQTIPNLGLRARGFGGAAVNTGKYDALIPDPYGAPKGDVARNVWYHFVLHVRWSPNGDGLMEGWLNGRKYQSYQGPTLYAGMGCYLKLANYHAPFGKSSSVVFDRVVRGSSAAAVSALALEGIGNTPSTPVPTPTPSTATYALSTITMGSGSGTVTSSPSGIHCGSSCTTQFASGTSVTLTAVPASGATFAGWSGACSGTGSCSVAMSGAKSVTATFNAATSSTGSTGSGTTGTGVTPSASSLGGFSTTRTQQVRFTNNTSTKVTFIKASMSSARYSQTNTCGEVAPGSSCTATVTYHPTNSGSDTGTFTVTSSAPNSPHVVSLSTGAATVAAPSTSTTPSSTNANGVIASATALDFSGATTRTVTFRNNTTTKVTFIKASMTSTRFGQSNNCGEVAPGASCTASVTYYPSGSGSDSGTFTVTSTAPNSPHVVSLAGTGQATLASSSEGSSTSSGLGRGDAVAFGFTGREDRR